MKLTDQTARQFFAALFRGENHLPSEMRRDADGVYSVVVYGGLSTFDYDELTRLVLLSHQHGVRARVYSSGPKRIRIGIAGHGFGTDATGHPTIRQAIEKFEHDDDSSWLSYLKRRDVNS